MKSMKSGVNFGLAKSSSHSTCKFRELLKLYLDGNTIALKQTYLLNKYIGEKDSTLVLFKGYVDG